MTNFKNPKPYIEKVKPKFVKSTLDKEKLIKEATKLIEKNRQITRELNNSSNATLHR